MIFRQQLWKICGKAVCEDALKRALGDQKMPARITCYAKMNFVLLIENLQREWR